MTTERKPTHPGEVLLEDVLRPLGVSITDGAKMLGVTRKALSELVNGRAGLSPTMALRIAKATNTSPESWFRMQANLDLWEARKKEPHNVTRFPKQPVTAAHS